MHVMTRRHGRDDDVVKLQREVDGVKIRSKTRQPEQECEVCIQGKCAQTGARNLQS